MSPDLPSLSEADKERIREVLSSWAEAHPRPDVPLIQLLDGSELTPLDMAWAVAHPDTARGRLLLRVLATGMIEDEVEPAESLTEILADYERDTRAWSDLHTRRRERERRSTARR